MVYSGTNSLQYVKNYANGTGQWSGFPITVDVPGTSIMLGVSGSISSSDLQTMVKSVQQSSFGRLGGVMAWFSSVKDNATDTYAFQYAGGAPDASNKQNTDQWKSALQALQA